MPPSSPPPFVMNISHTSPDVTVQQVLDQIDNEVLVVDALGPDGVQGVIDGWSQRTRTWRVFSLDLISHSRRGVLQLGDWSVDGTGKSQLLQQACAAQLARLGLSEIRLLGCNTAVTPGGQAAMVALAQVFRVPVKGTTVPISAADFDASGFRPKGYLAGHDRLPPLVAPLAASAKWLDRFQAVTGHTVKGLLAKLRRESLSDSIRDWSRTRPQLRWPIRQITRRALDALLDRAGPKLSHVPGLLALPDLELLVPIEGDFGAPRYHRFTLLLDGLWLRMYPRDQPEGIVLRTREDVLAAALGQGTELLRN